MFGGLSEVLFEFHWLSALIALCLQHDFRQARFRKCQMMAYIFVRRLSYFSARLLCGTNTSLEKIKSSPCCPTVTVKQAGSHKLSDLNRAACHEKCLRGLLFYYLWVYVKKKKNSTKCLSFIADCTCRGIIIMKKAEFEWTGMWFWFALQHCHASSFTHKSIQLYTHAGTLSSASAKAAKSNNAE